MARSPGSTILCGMERWTEYNNGSLVIVASGGPSGDLNVSVASTEAAVVTSDGDASGRQRAAYETGAAATA